MLKLLVTLDCFMTLMVCTNCFDKHDQTKQKIMECEIRCNDEYTDCIRVAKNFIVIYGCIKMRDNCRKNCYSKNDEIGKNEFTDEEDWIVFSIFISVERCKFLNLHWKHLKKKHHSSIYLLYWDYKGRMSISTYVGAWSTAVPVVNWVRVKIV